MRVTIRDYAVSNNGNAFVTRVVSERGQIMAHGGIHNRAESEDHLRRAREWVSNNRPEWVIVECVTCPQS